MEQWWSALGASENHNVPTFKKSAPHYIQNHTAHTLIESNCCCHDRSISEPAAIKIIWPRARARNYCCRLFPTTALVAPNGIAEIVIVSIYATHLLPFHLSPFFHFFGQTSCPAPNQTLKCLNRLERF